MFCRETFAEVAITLATLRCNASLTNQARASLTNAPSAANLTASPAWCGAVLSYFRESSYYRGWADDDSQDGSDDHGEDRAKKALMSVINKQFALRKSSAENAVSKAEEEVIAKSCRLLAAESTSKKIVGLTVLVST